MVAKVVAKMVETMVVVVPMAVAMATAVAMKVARGTGTALSHTETAGVTASRVTPGSDWTTLAQDCASYATETRAGY